jgi:hypothetical protein
MGVLAGVMILLCAAGLPQAKGEDANAANSVFASATPDREVVCDLRFKPSGFNLGLTAKADASIKETNGPNFEGRKVSRGVIQSREPNAKPMLFVWDKSKGNLYLDLNNNLDLTDDVNGVFSSGPGKFDKMQVERQFGETRVPYVIRAYLFYSSDYYQFTVLSGFEGEAELGSKRRRISFADNMNGIAGTGDYFAITSADSNFRPPADEPGIYAPNDVFLDGKNWAVSYEFMTVDGQACVRARFKETPRETGKVLIEGKFIRYLTLKNGRSITVFENIEGEVVAPAGKQTLGQIFLDGGKAGLFERNTYSYEQLDVRKNETLTLKAGGPLNNSVKVKHIGRVLQFSYKLVGADEKEYTSRNRNAENAPKFAVFKGDKEIGSGTFKFG